jgi:hypothetical protein
MLVRLVVKAKKDGLRRVIERIYGCSRSCPGYPVMNYPQQAPHAVSFSKFSSHDIKTIQTLRSELTFSMFIHPPNPAPRSKTGVSLGSSDLTILSPETFRKEVVGAILAMCVVP